MNKWLCINNYSAYDLTLNKVYDGEYNQLRDLIFVVDNSGRRYGYHPPRFKNLSDIREEQIKSIFDDE